MTAPMTRKAFCARLTGATVVLLIQGCGGGGDDAAPAGSTTGGASGTTGCTDSIGLNHGHVMTVASADLDLATDKVYDIMGSASHNHRVTLTVAQLRALKAGTLVTVTSTTTDAHEHAVSIRCI